MTFENLLAVIVGYIIGNVIVDVAEYIWHKHNG